MPQSLSNILVHLTFSTKERRPDIHPGVEADLHGYLSGMWSTTSSTSGTEGVRE